jgi:two-component system OmpR family sensor kinase
MVDPIGGMSAWTQRGPVGRIEPGRQPDEDEEVTTLPIPVLRTCAPTVDVEHASRLVAIATAAPTALHELASSLQIMGGVEVMAEVLADGPVAVREASARAVASWRRAEALFASLRRLLRGGDLVRWAVEVDVAIATAVAQVERTWPAAHIRVDAGAGTRAMASEPLLVHVVGELIRNAVRATPEGGAVDVSVEVLAQTVTIRVTDDGPGAPAHAVAHLDDPEAALDGGHRGAGLVAASLLLRQHGGVLSHRREPGRGSSFAATLPRA